MELTMRTPDGKPFRSVKLKKTTDRMSKNMDKGLVQAAILLQGSIKKDFLSGQVLNVRTNRLRSSVTYTNPEGSPGGRFLKVGTNVKYAPIHEYGATIVPKTAKVLRFNIPGVGWRSAHKVIIPPRPFMKPALKDNSDKIVRIIQKSVTKEFI